MLVAGSGEDKTEVKERGGVLQGGVVLRRDGGVEQLLRQEEEVACASSCSASISSGSVW